MNSREQLAEDKVNILVVDDVPEKLVSMQVILQDLDENVITVQSGRDALRQLLEREFAVILLDVNMPDIDGFETASLIRQRQKSEHVPIIFITAFNDDTHALQGYSLGAVDYILAPVVPDVLRTKVAVFVDLFKKNKQIEQQAEQRIALVEEQAAREAAEDATRRSMFLARASDSLSKSLNYENTLKALLQLALPVLGDVAGVGITTDLDSQGQFELAAVGQASPKVENVTVSWDELPERFSLASDRALETGKTQRMPASGPICQGLGTSIKSRLFGAADALMIPLTARGRTLGVFCVAREKSKKDFMEAEVALAEDLAARAAIAIDNARLYREIQDRDRRKDEFLAMLGHELRNPLAAIANALDCMHAVPNDQEILARAQEVLERQVPKMSRLVDDLLDVSRITRGKVDLRIELIELRSVVNRAAASVKAAMDARRHKLTVTLPEQPLRLQADPIRLEQILANLLNNAAKYTEPGGKIDLTAACEGSQVVIRVRDTGMGISPQLLPKVFDLFTQGDRSLDRSQGGLGIGLTLAKSLITMHGGQIQAFSEGHLQGSEFIVRLPAHSGIIPTEARADAASEATHVAKPWRVLLVDDNPDLTTTMAALLSRLGHDVRTAADGPSCFDIAAEFLPEVLLIDIGLPGMNGFEVAQYLREQPATAEAFLVAVTGYGQAEDRQRSKDAGFDEHLVKPVPMSALQDLLARLDADRRSAGAPAASGSTVVA